MKKYDIKIGVVYSGNYAVINANKLGEKIADNKIKPYLMEKVKGFKILNKYVLEKYKEQPDFKVHLCASCKNLLKCPKVMGDDKKSFKKYPFIKSGIETILINKQVYDAYCDAINTYRNLIQYEDIDLDDFSNLKEKLYDDGIEIMNFSIFECDMFVDDDDDISHKVFTDQEKVGTIKASDNGSYVKLLINTKNVE